MFIEFFRLVHTRNIQEDTSLHLKLKSVIKRKYKSHQTPYNLLGHVLCYQDNLYMLHYQTSFCFTHQAECF